MPRRLAHFSDPRLEAQIEVHGYRRHSARVRRTGVCPRLDICGDAGGTRGVDGWYFGAGMEAFLAA